MPNPSTPLLKKSILQGLTDRIAKQHDYIRSGLEQANLSGAGYFYTRIHDGLCDDPLQPLGDALFEGTLVPPADDLDNNFSSGNLLSSTYGSFVAAMQGYAQANGLDDMDDWLSQLDLNVHEDFDSVYQATNGQHLDAINVFRARQVQMGRVDVSSSGVGTFTDGVALGTGTGKFNPNTNSAGAQLVAYLGSGSSPSANDLVLNMTLTDEDSTNSVNQLVTIPAGSVAGDSVNIGTSTDKWLDVVSCVFAGGDAGQVVAIKNIIERNASL
jgi:hypothetical protein